MGQDNGKEDDQQCPLTPGDIVRSQPQPISAIRNKEFKYRVSRPPPPPKEVSTDGRLAEAAGGAGMTGPAMDRPDDAPDTMPPVKGPSSLTVGKKTCPYRKGGLCKEHGPGGKERWKPVYKLVTDEAGRQTTVSSKKYFLVCDTGLGNKKLKQTTLSFNKTTPVRTNKSPLVADNVTDNLTNEGERLGVFNDAVEKTTLSGGIQQQHCVKTDVTREKIVDEKLNSR